MTNLKDNIRIEGFDSDTYIQEERLRFGCNKILYSGKTSEIPEEVAKECVDHDLINKDESNFFPLNYKSNVYEYENYSATESIKSACDKPYCIIYKK